MNLLTRKYGGVESGPEGIRTPDFLSAIEA
jgi:hypothetical protein